MTLESFITPRSETPPSGENLEYDQAFIEMEIAAQPGEETQKGNEIIPGEDPDWREVVSKASEVLERSHDLRAGAVWTAGLLHTRGLPGLADGTTYMRTLLEEFWDTCHPVLDADDNDDPTMRINAVKGLASHDLILKQLRRIPMTESRAFGRVPLRDIQIAFGELPAPEGHSGSDREQIRAAFEDTAMELREAMHAAAKTAAQNIRAMDAVFLKRTPGYGPNLDEVSKLLQTIIRIIGEYVAAPAAEEPTADEAGAEATVASAAPRPSQGGRQGGAPGTIGSRDDVIAAIDAISKYYKDYEPSSPVPILLARAKRLVKADFLEILKDMAPSGIDSVNMIGGIGDR